MVFLSQECTVFVAICTVFVAICTVFVVLSPLLRRPCTFTFVAGAAAAVEGSPRTAVEVASVPLHADLPPA